MTEQFKVKVTKEKLADLAGWVIKIYTHACDFRKLAEEIIDVVVKKNHDYGDAWQRYGIYTPLIRLNDKLLRVKTLAGGQDALVADEGIKDTLMDIVGYGLLALLYLTEKGSQLTVQLDEEGQPVLPGVYSEAEERLKLLVEQDNAAAEREDYDLGS